MSEETVYHVPVLLHPSIDGMNIQPGGIYVDVTFGGGGHSREILNRLDDTAHLYSFDQDEDAEKNAFNDPRFTFVRSNFRYLRNFMRYYGCNGVDAILADLGVSSHHFDDSERGFSFRFEGKLDMRMNKRSGMTAADILNTYSEERLADIFYLYGELKNSRKLASVIAKARTSSNIESIEDFLKIVKPLFGREREKKELAKVFQALRIEVNHAPYISTILPLGTPPCPKAASRFILPVEITSTFIFWLSPNFIIDPSPKSFLICFIASSSAFSFSFISFFSFAFAILLPPSLL